MTQSLRRNIINIDAVGAWRMPVIRSLQSVPKHRPLLHFQTP
jgi:hypothetical protein